MASLRLLAVALLATAATCHGQYTVYRQDPFALLSGTLQTYQRAACDSQGPISQNYISAEKDSRKFSSSNFGQI
jgi:hypothetical protein